MPNKQETKRFWETMGKSIQQMTRYAKTGQEMTPEDRRAEARQIHQKVRAHWPKRVVEGVFIPTVRMLIKDCGMRPQDAEIQAEEAIRNGARIILKTEIRGPIIAAN